MIRHRRRHRVSQEKGPVGKGLEVELGFRIALIHLKDFFPGYEETLVWERCGLAVRLTTKRGPPLYWSIKDADSSNSDISISFSIWRVTSRSFGLDSVRMCSSEPVRLGSVSLFSCVCVCVCTSTARAFLESSL